MRTSLAHPLRPAREPAASLEERDDDELMQLACAGMERAFETLIRRYQKPLRAFCERACGNGAGDEIVQEIFVTVWACRHSYEPRGRFQSYLFTIAYRRSRNALRAGSRQSSGGLFDPPAGHSPVDDVIAHEQRTRLDALLQKLSQEQRSAILLHYSAGLDYDEIARIVRRPSSTIRARVFSGLARLRRFMKSGGEL